MGSYNSAVITTAGQSLIARAIAGNLPCTLTSAKTTDYVVPGSTSLASLTSLPDIKQSEVITSASVVSNTQVSASVRFSNTDIALNYMINTIGVYAKAGDDTSETLLAVITAIDPDVMPSYSASSPVSYVYDITLTISNASQVNIIVAPTGSPNYSEFNAVKNQLSNEVTRAEDAEASLQSALSAETAARQAADTSLQSAISVESSTRATQDAVLQAEIDQIIAPSGEAPSAAEVANARIGSDGTVYPTLGDAIRTQNSDLKSAISSVCTVFSPYKGEGGSNVGDCTVISANGINIIIDFGSASQYQTLSQNILSHGYTKFDYAVISHYHTDHIGGVQSFLTDNRFDFSDCKFYVPPTDIDFTQMVGYDASGVSYATPKQYAEKQTEILALIEQYTSGYVVTGQNQVLSFSQFFKCKFFTAGSAAYSALYQVANEQGVCIINNFSMCCLISFGNTNMLFSGDIEKAGQSYAYANIDKDIDFYKVEHHAFDLDTDANWLNRITPRYALIQGSSGKDPSRVSETLNHFSGIGTLIVSNGISRNAVFSVTADDIGLKEYDGNPPMRYMRYVTEDSFADVVEIAKKSERALINFQLISDTALDLPFNVRGAIGTIVMNPAGTYGYAEVISYYNVWLATWNNSTTPTWEKVNRSLTMKTYYFTTSDLTENAYISPFTYYGEKDISADLAAYGRLVSVVIKSPSTCPTTYSVSGSHLRLFSTKNAKTITVEIYYDSGS